MSSSPQRGILADRAMSNLLLTLALRVVLLAGKLFSSTACTSLRVYPRGLSETYIIINEYVCSKSDSVIQSSDDVQGVGVEVSLPV